MKIAVPDLLSNAYFPAEAAVKPGFFHSEKLDISLEMAAPVEEKAHAARRGTNQEGGIL
jgi:hypothetical protein